MTADTPDPHHTAARELAAILREHNRRLVLAESCTAGLVAATLAEVPGISEFLCGSAVVYQVATKVEWLGIDPALIATHNVVSEKVAVEMARRVLAQTPHADIAGAITGHLGPNADPPELDGIAWCAVTDRTGDVTTRMLNLPDTPQSGNLRIERQQAAATGLLSQLAEFVLESTPRE